jgi:YegS/Rv2252/BmrU family lipid kinase
VSHSLASNSDPRPVPRRLLLIANPVSGGDARPRIARAVAWFEARGVKVEIMLTGRSGDARLFAARAREHGCDRIVAAGGDGTLNEVLNGLAPSSIPVAFLPLGTTNVFTYEAGLPRELEAACRVALEGVPRPVCLGVADGERFLLMASAGFDAATVHRVDLRLKRRTGKLAYAVSAVATLLDGPLPTFEVTGDDGLARAACQVVAGNGRYYGGRLSLTPSASLFAERLDVCMVAPMSRLRFVLTAIALLAGLTPAGVVRYVTGRLTLRGDGIPLQIDGDDRGTLPRQLSVTSGEVWMVFPDKR